MDLDCAICGNAESNRTLEVREMMFGTRELFTYLACSACESLRLVDVPHDLSKYYGAGYYSVRQDFRRWVRRHMLAYRLAHLVMRRRLPYLPEWWPTSHADRSTAVLDVGSGAANLLLRLQSLGFTNLLGIDPYLEADIQYGGGLMVRRQSLEQAQGHYDVVLMNHSLEHMPDPLGVLRKSRSLLRAGGTLVIRTPVASSWARREYGSDWVQIDAPRHLFVHSEKGIRHLAEAAGLITDVVMYDSTALQFWGSEQYRRSIPFTDRRSYAVSPCSSIFARGEIRDFERRARELNRRGEGDQACFHLTPRLT